MNTDFFRKYYVENKGRYFSSYKPIKFVRELDKRYPYRVERRKQHYYKYFSTYYKAPLVPFTVTWATKEKPIILSYD